ncbi:hypothetical protein [Paenibacillus donghaensis]|uniref:hypothetical protein n=1 Tax=Paenibacillus donghaensis TaxID=414771 RepID=UPI001FE2FF3B|nr:hypothetical protein [Paenibacillus donghaensis]
MRRKNNVQRFLSLLFASILIVSTVTACSGNKPQNGADSNFFNQENVSTDKEPVAFSDLSGDIRGNKAPTEEQINEVNLSLNDTYLGDVYDEVIPSDYSAYPVEGDMESRRKTTVTDNGKLLGFYGIAPYNEGNIGSQ